MWALRKKNALGQLFPPPGGGRPNVPGRYPSNGSGPIKDALHARRVELLQIELESQGLGDLAQALPLLAQRLCTSQRGLLSGFRHKPAINHVPAELPLTTVVEPLFGPMALRIADPLTDASFSATADRIVNTS